MRKPAFSRYAVASLAATATSQLVLFALYRWAGVDAALAGLVAFVVGAVPRFVLLRWWAWDRHGRAHLTGQLTGYAVTTALGGLVSVALTAGADWLVGPLVADPDARALVLNAAYVLSGLPVFLAKYAVLDRLFAPAPEPPAVRTYSAA
ncbi:hypothetical protein BJP25_03805 [Actinokineospora bangkokensis]|uniref:GtrA/DPMS transmembrane domain-containing protein n=1 Tax=Actinokineospora bangkokensis TaxID=1193682 RepID=A0A1Q9LEA0_9PSEU|nr:hypothetical protein BJP25_03805 [Actinokineospora bangkokensis]